jgi:hypothetical protein
MKLRSIKRIFDSAVMKYFFILISCFLAQFSFSQNVEIPSFPFIKLKTGQLITGKNLQFDDRVFGASTVNLDGKTVKTRELAFFGDNQNQVFGRVGMDGIHQSVYNNRNIYMYKIVKTNYSPGYGYGGYGGFGYPRYGGYGGSYSQSVYYYYSVGVTAMKRLYVTNLVMDLKDDMVAMGYVYRGLKYRRISQGFFLASSASLAYALYNASNVRTFKGCFGAALGGYLVSFGFYAAKYHMAKQAMNKYCGYNFY